jgi:hypothetical protein
MEDGAMNDTVKKVGSSFVVILLAVMMIVTLGRWSLADVLEGFFGAKYGYFDGEDMDARYYFQEEERCRQAYSMFGEGKIHDCLVKQLRSLYVLPRLATRLGLSTSKETVQADLMAQIMENQRAQEALPSDDRLTPREEYNRMLQQFPMDLRVREKGINALVQAFSGMREADNAIGAHGNIETDSIQLRLVRFTALDLQNQTGTFQVTEDEIKARHEKEQSIFEPSARKTYESQRDFVKNRIEGEKKQAAVAEVKKQLANLGKEYKMSDVERITRKPAIAKTVKVMELSNVALPNGEFAKLDSPDFILALGGKAPVMVGPIQDGEGTIYVEIQSVTSPPAKPQEERVEQISQWASMTFLDLAVKREGQRGKFKVRQGAKEAPAVPPPDL